MLKIPIRICFRKKCSLYIPKNHVSYVQGQEPRPSVREYFYFIDHQGMLFLDDSKMKNFTSCFKEKKFLKFFFSRLVKNDTGRYEDFPFLSKCGRELNYVRCDDCPFVFTHIFNKTASDGCSTTLLAHNHGDNSMSLPFQPEKLLMFPKSGRLYHPAPERVGSIGLIQSKLAIELSKSFIFENGETYPPTKFTFMGEVYSLDNQLYGRFSQEGC